MAYSYGTTKARMSDMINKKYGINDDFTAADTPTTTSGSGADGMGATDWASIGMQVAGALMEDAEKEKERKSKEELQNKSWAREDEQQRKLIAIRNKEHQDAMRIQNRTQNMQGLNYLTALTDSNAKTAREHPFYTTLFGGGIR